jgi:PIN domain nuclease of toxin-antitoxin system
MVSGRARICASWLGANAHRSARPTARSADSSLRFLGGLRSCQPPGHRGRRVSSDVSRPVRVVADTHALIWFLEADERLSARVREVLEQAQQDPDGGIVVSAASRIDLHYLQWAGRFSRADVQRWWAVTQDPSWNISPAAITDPVVAYFDSAEVAALRDPWDRLITATAIDLELPLVTKDRAITTIGEAGAVDIIW